MSEEAARLLAQAIEDALERLIAAALTGVYFPIVAQADETQETGGEQVGHYDD